MKLRKKQVNCIGCSSDKLNMEQYDYNKYGASCSKIKAPEANRITWKEFIESYDQKKLFLDVRPANHYNIVHLLNSINIPY